MTYDKTGNRLHRPMSKERSVKCSKQSAMTPFGRQALVQSYDHFRNELAQAKNDDETVRVFCGDTLGKNTE